MIVFQKLLKFFFTNANNQNKKNLKRPICSQSELKRFDSGYICLELYHPVNELNHEQTRQTHRKLCDKINHSTRNLIFFFELIFGWS